MFWLRSIIAAAPASSVLEHIAGQTASLVVIGQIRPAEHVGFSRTGELLEFGRHTSPFRATLESHLKQAKEARDEMTPSARHSP